MKTSTLSTHASVNDFRKTARLRRRRNSSLRRSREIDIHLSPSFSLFLPLSATKNIRGDARNTQQRGTVVAAPCHTACDNSLKISSERSIALSPTAARSRNGNKVSRERARKSKRDGLEISFEHWFRGDKGFVTARMQLGGNVGMGALIVQFSEGNVCILHLIVGKKCLNFVCDFNK